MMKLRAAQVLIGLVLLFNVQCAIAFLFNPSAYAPSFELQGAQGRAMVQGIGLLFLMWNVPYAVAAVNPRRFRVSLCEAVAMQAIGVLGESVLLGLLPGSQEILRATIWRFIYFDGGGLAALIGALWFSRS